ncbi:SHOCT domain-containing protein [Tunturibacter empetritectus]|uniref:Membrane protein n=1 Tax=Tunturiibacter lichenicola TaxID=2051959 RepID=A0A7W8N607_9BACT|nr:SHOCT domain-containing protein [Edaphobacter lichenicola]MBB5345091.1 putative membrane protein [Edaphobacter lichenicola]
MKTLKDLSKLSVLILFAGCAGPMGPLLGLGPGWDEVAGITVVAIVVALAYRPIRKLFSNRLNAADFASPQNIVRERYARGEISQEEFQRIMQLLSER